MRKHWQYFQTAFTQSLQFRGEIIVWIVLGILPTIIFLIAWNSIFTGQATINGFTFGEMVQYYLIISFLGNITGVYFESWRSAQIREGTVDHHLIKPLSFPRMIALSDLGRKMLYIVFSLPFFLALIFVLIKLQVPLPAILLTPSTILALGFMIIFAYLLEFIVALMVVMATFWFEGAEGLQHFKWFFCGAPERKNDACSLYA